MISQQDYQILEKRFIILAILMGPVGCMIGYVLAKLFVHFVLGY